MPARLGGGGQAVLDGFPLHEPALAREPASHELARRGAGEGAEVAVQVRLVVVAAQGREVGEAEVVVRAAQGL